MKLNEFKEIIKTTEHLSFVLPSGESVPAHYHVTEVGSITKNFIDCGGTIREEKVVNFQLWHADDDDHKLAPEKMLAIIELSETKLGIGNHEIEVEYQSDTIGKYSLSYNGKSFVLGTKMTDCLASDKCGIPEEKKKMNLSDLVVQNNSCTPGGGCC